MMAHDGLRLGLSSNILRVLEMQDADVTDPPRVLHSQGFSSTQKAALGGSESQSARSERIMDHELSKMTYSVLPQVP